jgi:hypothetical protein
MTKANSWWLGPRAMNSAKPHEFRFSVNNDGDIGEAVVADGEILPAAQ